MGIRGWLYVLSNKAMPGLLKIGYSTKDPALRIGELDGTGLPHPFEIEYDILISDPREVEQLVHKQLVRCREAKEFFRTDLQTVIDAVAEVLDGLGRDILLEQWREGSGSMDTSRGPYFTLGEDTAQPTWQTASGFMAYRCRDCGHITTVPTSHQARCSSCGKLGLIA